MLSIVGTILGLLGGAIPELIKYFKTKQDHKHEIEVFKLQIEADKLKHDQRIEEINVNADIAESQALYKAAEQKITGSPILDGIVSLYNSSVRPTITYAFMALYAYVKYSLIYNLTQDGMDWRQVGQHIWSAEDFAVFSTVLAFWFGGRFMRYSLQRMDTYTHKR